MCNKDAIVKQTKANYLPVPHKDACSTNNSNTICA